MTGKSATTDRSEPRLERLDASNLPEVVAVHCDAFRGYPTMDFVLGAGGGDYDERLRTLIGLFVDTIHLQGGVGLGVRQGAELVAAADAVAHGAPEPPELVRRRQDAWQRLGEPARSRYESYSAATRAFARQEPSFYLSMLGVRPSAVGRGLARLLVDQVQELSRQDPISTGVHLETEHPRNVAFYRHLGFRLTGHVEVGGGLESWGFFRPDAALPRTDPAADRRRSLSRT